MKKTRFLAFILTFAMLLSTFVAVIPASATTTEATSNNKATSTLLGSNTIKIDGAVDDFWATVPVQNALTLNNFTEDGKTAAGTDPTTIPDPATIKIANDGEFVYFLYEAKYLPASYFFIQIGFGDAVGGANASTDNKTTGEWTFMRLYCDKNRSGANLVGATRTSVGTGLGALSYGEVLFDTKHADYTTQLEDGDYVWEGMDFGVTSDGQTSVSTLNNGYGACVLEIKFPIPESAKEKLANGELTNMYINVFERTGYSADRMTSVKGAVQFLPGGDFDNTEKPKTEVVLASNVAVSVPRGNNAITTIDGAVDDFWATVPVQDALTLNNFTSDGITAAGTDPNTVPDPATIKIANDGEFVYFLYQATYLPANYFFIQIGFGDAVGGTDASTDNKMTGEWTFMTLYVDKDRSGANLVGATRTSVGTGLGALSYGQDLFDYDRFKYSSTYPDDTLCTTPLEDGDYVWEGMDFGVTSDGKTSVSTLNDGYGACVLEIKFPIPESAKEKLANGEQTSMYINVYEKTNYSADRTTKDSGAGYFLPGGDFDNTTKPKTQVILSGTPATSTLLGNNTLTVTDGAVDAFWENVPVQDALTLNNYTADGVTATATTEVVPSPSTIKIANDGEFVYFLYEATYLPKNALHIQIGFGDAVGGIDASTDNKTYGDWTYLKFWCNKNRSGDNLVGATRTDVTHGLGGFSYGEVAAYTSCTTQIVDGDYVWEKMDYGIVGTGTSGTNDLNGNYATCTLEFKFPLPESAKADLATGKLTNMYINVYENTDYSADRTTSTSGGGQFLPGGNFDETTTPKTRVTLRSSAPILVGVQDRLDTATDTVDIRFAAATALTDFDLANSTAGFDFTYHVDESTALTANETCQYVYTKLYNGKDESGNTNPALQPINYGGTYFFCFTISGLEKGGTYVFDITCWTKTGDADAIYCVNPTTLTVTVDADGKANFTY